MSRPTPDTAAPSYVSPTGLSPPVAVLPRDIRLRSKVTYAVHTPACTHTGLGSSAFARRYLQNHCYFLFLRLLRCFSSPGSPPSTMDSCKDTCSLCMWVSPFRHLRIKAYLQLPAAFRSLSRLSSALSAKASTLRSYSLHHVVIRFAVARFAYKQTSPRSAMTPLRMKAGFHPALVVHSSTGFPLLF